MWTARIADAPQKALKLASLYPEVQLAAALQRGVIWRLPADKSLASLTPSNVVPDAETFTISDKDYFLKALPVQVLPLALSVSALST